MGKRVERVNLSETPLFTVQDSVSAVVLWNMIQLIREDEELPPVPARRVRGSKALCLNSRRRDINSLSGLVDGGNHRAVAHLIEDRLLGVEVELRKTAVPSSAVPIVDIAIAPAGVFDIEKRSENPGHFTHVPSDDDVAYMQDRLHEIRKGTHLYDSVYSHTLNTALQANRI